ncbi:MAG: hypothetical protein M3458_21860 [Acidobacteriota bacterium]|nr:hypothetical protein [Acidobacteriota bacterium]
MTCLLKICFVCLLLFVLVIAPWHTGASGQAPPLGFPSLSFNPHQHQTGKRKAHDAPQTSPTPRGNAAVSETSESDAKPEYTFEIKPLATPAPHDNHKDEQAKQQKQEAQQPQSGVHVEAAHPEGSAAHSTPASATSHKADAAHARGDAHATDAAHSGAAAHGGHARVRKFESEYFGGQHGYRLGGISFATPVGKRFSLKLGTRFVRESSKTPTFPSVAAMVGMQVSRGVEVEAFTFGYLPKDDQFAIGAGLRAEKHLFDFRMFGQRARVSGFFSPVYVNVKAHEAESHVSTPGVPHEEPLPHASHALSVKGDMLAATAAGPVLPLVATVKRNPQIGQVMLLGGGKLDLGKINVSVFGSGSFFSRSAKNLETPVDVEEMTHIATYINNAGFMKNSVGTEVSFKPHRRLSLTSGYARIRFDGLALRHSFLVRPSVNFGREGREVEIFGGYQILRGGHADNKLGTIGIAFHF